MSQTPPPLPPSDPVPVPLQGAIPPVPPVPPLPPVPAVAAVPGVVPVIPAVPLPPIPAPAAARPVEAESAARMNTAASALKAARPATTGVVIPPAGNGWKAVATILFLLLLATGALAGWNIWNLRKGAPPAKGLPTDVVAAQKEIQALQEKLKGAQDAEKLASAGFESTKAELASLRAGAGEGGVERLKSDLALAEKRATDTELALQAARREHFEAEARLKETIQSLTQGKQADASRVLSDAERKYKADIEGLTAQVKSLSEQLEKANAGSAEAGKLQIQLAGVQRDLATTKSVADTLRLQLEERDAGAKRTIAQYDAALDAARKNAAADAVAAKAERDRLAAELAGARRETEDARRDSAAAADAAKAQVKTLHERIAALKGENGGAGNPGKGEDEAAETAQLRDQLAESQKLLADARKRIDAATEAAESAKAQAADLQAKLDKANKTPGETAGGNLVKSGGVVNVGSPFGAPDPAENARLAAIARDNRQRAAARGKITKVAVSHNVVVGGQQGMLVKLSYQITGLKGLRGMVGAWLVDEKGRSLTAGANAPATAKDAAGALVAVGRFSVNYDNATFTDEQLFFPYTAFPVPAAGKQINTKVHVVLFAGDGSADETQYSIATDDSQPVQIGGR